MRQIHLLIHPAQTNRKPCFTHNSHVFEMYSLFYSLRLLTYLHLFQDNPCKPFANKTQYEVCGATNMTTCRDTCTMTCIWISCMINVTSPTNRTKVPTENFGACLPKNLSADEYETRCRGVVDVPFWVVRTDNCSGVVIPEPPPSSNAWIWITIFLIIALFAGIVIYYRYSVFSKIVQTTLTLLFCSCNET